jgi:DNA-binding response OmpR family regulator
MPKPATTKLKILVVDDEPLVCDTVKMLLTFDGHAAETAHDAEAALAAFAPGKYDLIVVDYEMPGMKGDQLAAALKEKSPRQPILMITAHGDMLRTSGRSLTGIDLIVDKPFRLDVLRDGITKLIADYAEK